MSPDMKRLCEAASNVELDMYPDYLRDEEAEKVVRAVLTALRDVSEDVAQDSGLASRGIADWEGGAAIGRAVTTAMIDAILGEPATA